MIRLALPILSALALGACSVTGGQAGRDASPGAQQALRLAASLSEAARVDDPVLAHVTDEMDALEAALARGVPLAEAPPVEEEPSLALVPAPDARQQSLLSLMHGIHLASYREERHVAEGWRALQGQHASLSGLQARHVPADLGERGVYLRLVAGPFDNAQDAATACRVIQAAQNWCAVTAFDGTPVHSPQ